MAKLRTRLFELIREKELAEMRPVQLKEIAEAIDVDEHTVARWVKNEVIQFNAAIVERLCRYFDKRDLGDVLYIDWDAPETARKPRKKSGGDV